MKILVIAPYYPPHIGGLENYAAELNKRLASEKIDVPVFTPHLPTDSPANETLSGDMKIVRFPAFEIIHNYPVPKFWSRAFRKGLSGLKKNDFDCVVSHTRFFLTSLIAFRFSKTQKIKWVHIEHGSDFVSIRWPFDWISRAYDHTFGKLALNKADEVIAISESVAKFVRKLAPKTNPAVIYRGFDARDFEMRDSEKDTGLNAFKIIFIGRLIIGKGVNYLLESLTLLKNENFELALIGDGPEREALEDFIEKSGLEDKVRFLGPLPHFEVMNELVDSDLFINPSLNEGLPTTVIEAAFCKKPIIATNVGGTGEIITDGIGGFIIEPKNPAALSRKIMEIMTDRDLAKKMGVAAFDEVSGKFDWNENLQKIISVLKSDDGKK